MVPPQQRPTRTTTPDTLVMASNAQHLSDSRATIARLTHWLALAWLLCGLLSTSLASAISLPALIAAAWACLPVAVGLFAGLVFLSAALPIRNLEPSFAIIAAGLGRLLAGVLAGVVVQRLSGADDRSFWLAFVAIMGAVMAAEVIAVRRILDPLPAQQEASRA